MKVLFAGDYFPSERIIDQFKINGFGSVLGEVKKLNESVDYSIVNFECNVAGGKDEPIRKSGPCLKTEDIGVDALKWAGFDLLCLANNHFRDYGSGAVARTIKVIKNKNLDFVGGGHNIQEASSILYKVICDKTIAFINVCENEFSIANENRGGSKPLNPITQYYEIREAHKKADYVFVIIHGGHEYCQEPSLRMKQTYRFFIDAGADAIINHHQHCYCSYEVYNGKPIFYGLGNFCFDKISENLPETWNYGYIVILNIEDQDIAFEVLPFEQCLNSINIHFLEDKNSFVNHINRLNDILADEKRLSNFLHHFYKSQPLLGITIPQLCGHWWRLRKYVAKHIHPMWYYDLRDMILCESHYERIGYEIENKIDNK
jgi:poly-gamma-glutamate synthesis protein (capsule biosynthesis protein)